jgi:hypothetical protein
VATKTAWDGWEGGIAAPFSGHRLDLDGAAR